jgi:dihydrofolate synthase/folylpolyglutamate synthase
MGQIAELTGLMGRWQILQKEPLVVCDTGHNAGAWKHLTPQLQQKAGLHPHLRMIVGMANDKDIDAILPLMPSNALYYFTQASVGRALPVETLAAKARQFGLLGTVYHSVGETLETVMKEALPGDMIFIGGSNFVVADALPLFKDGKFQEENVQKTEIDDTDFKAKT